MTVSLNNYGQLHGEPLYEITLTNRNHLQVVLLNYGATLEKVLVPDGTNVILALPSAADYAKERNFLGGTVGRFVGRLVGHEWHRGDQVVTLPKGEGENAIHGGADGLDRQVFTMRYEEGAGFDRVELVFLDPAGHNGLPGNVLVHVTYTLDDEDRLTYAVHATTDEMTLFNPTNHVYFAVDGPEAGIDETTLRLAADYYAPLTEHLPLTGWASVADTPFDFRQGQRLKDVMPKVLDGAGFDHPFLIKQPQAAKLIGASGRSVTMTTTAPSVVIYTANHFDHTGVAHNIGVHGGVTLETQVAPVSGQDWSAITLVPEQPYTQTTSWQFGY